MPILLLTDFDAALVRAAARRSTDSEQPRRQAKTLTPLTLNLGSSFETVVLRSDNRGSYEREYVFEECSFYRRYGDRPTRGAIFREGLTGRGAKRRGRCEVAPGWWLQGRNRDRQGRHQEYQNGRRRIRRPC